jgi:hypothetical protein
MHLTNEVHYPELYHGTFVLQVVSSLHSQSSSCRVADTSTLV